MRWFRINLTEFGLLVKALRKSSLDLYGNRWTRDSLSRAVHLTPHQLGRLERGDRKYLDTQTLELLSKAFNLTNLEKKEFFTAAVGLSDNYLFGNENPEAQLKKLIRMMEQLSVPAFAVDVYGDFIVANRSSMDLFCITQELIDYAHTIPIGLNVMNFIYSSEFGFKNIIGHGWRRMASIEMLLFRRSTLRYRHTEYFDYLMKNLSKEKQFDIDWYTSQRSPDAYDFTYEKFEYNHPRYGPISYIATETVVNTRVGDLYLLIYNPSDALTNKLFQEIRGSGNNSIKRLAPWPEKKMV